VLLPDPSDQAQAEQRLAAIQMLFDYRTDPQRFGSLRLQDGTPVTSSSRMTAYVAELTGVSERTIWLWLKRFQNGGLADLADHTRKDKNQSRFFSAYPKAAWLAAYLYLECKQSATFAYEAIVRDAAMIDVPEGDLPSYKTVRSWLRSMPPSLTTYARQGRKIYQERMSPYLTRGFTDTCANAVWVGDHMIHDVEVANDCFDNVEWGAPVRIRLTAWLDYRSRMVMGASWCWEGSSRSIAAAMRRGIAKYGPPECVYVDNGKDYRKVGKGALPGYMMESPLAPQGWWKAEFDSVESSGFLARVGTALTHCAPYHGQAKHIERFWGSVHEHFDKCWPTYTTGSPFTRPDATSLAMMQHRKLARHGRVAESKHPKASVFIAACLAWMEEYADTPHTGEGMDGGTPRQVFEANLNPRQKPAPDPATLALLMSEHERRQVRECAVTLNKHRYVPADQAGYAAIHNLNQCEILIAYEPGAPEDAAALDLDGNFICSLQTEELVRFAPWDSHTKELISESMAQRRHLEKQTREALSTITLIARQNGAQSPLEAMASRLRLPANADLSDVVTQRNPNLTKLSPDNDTFTRPKTPAEAARIFMEKQQ
jgi:hypothetical protein